MTEVRRKQWPGNPLPLPDDSAVTAIGKLITGFESEEITAARLPVRYRDGSVEIVEASYDTEEQRQEALARLRAILKDLADG